MIEIGLHSGGRMRVTEDSFDLTEVKLEDLAFGLSHVTRFGGQYGPFSVAEHSVNLCRWAKQQYHRGYHLRAILIHDGPECLGEGDVQRFVKRMFDCQGLRAFGDRLVAALWSHFCPEAGPWAYYSTGVKRFDVSGGAVEAACLGAPHDATDLPYFDKSPYYVRPRLIPAEQAREEWLHEWHNACV